jgi:hypothetical protein
MAFLGGLFDKKYCDFCGEKLGLFGNTTLAEGGHICKKCASQLSPWWSIGKTTSVTDVHEHLMYREENKAKVAEFKVTRSMGDNYKVLFDDEAGKIIITSASDFAKANPDVFDFADVTSATWEVNEDKTEVTTKDKDGKTKSYDPKRYTYRYNFYVTVYVKNPYFGTIKFKVNSSYVSIDPWAEFEARMAKRISEQMPLHRGAMYGAGDRYTPNVAENEDYQNYKALCDEIVEALNNK